MNKKINYLQESEIDTPEQIPTQTFTNQAFGVVQPPPPIPMPPHFQPPQQISPGTLPPTANHQVPPNGAPVVQQPAVLIPPANDDVALSKPMQQQPSEDIDKHSLGRAPPHTQNRTLSAQNNHQPQSFYNNGYSNRPNRPAQQHSRNNGVQHQGRPQTNRH